MDQHVSLVEPIHEIQKKRPWFFYVGAILIIAIVNLFFYEMILNVAFQGQKTVIIESGSGSRKIGALLKKEGVIRSKWAFVAYVSLRGEASQLKPGTYTFFEPTIPEISTDLVTGEAREKSITIPEGWSINDIASYLEKEKITMADTFKDIVKTESPKLTESFPFLKDRPAKAGLEGYLFPDTYRIYKDARPEEIIKRMLENFNKKLDPDTRNEIARQEKTIFEIITMASIIEKEVQTDEDRAVISGILWKRLDLGIALQVDASIVYITGNNKVSHNDLQIKSPYNTYRNRGLPAGPISNPGLSAIKAATYPKSSPYLYYLSTPKGETIFSKTLEEHNEAKVKYLTP